MWRLFLLDCQAFRSGYPHHQPTNPEPGCPGRRYLALDDVAIISSRDRLRHELHSILQLPPNLATRVRHRTLIDVLPLSRAELRICVVDVAKLFEPYPAPLPPLHPRPPLLLVVGYREDADHIIAAANDGIGVQVLEHVRPDALAEMVECGPKVSYLQRGVGVVTTRLVHQFLSRRLERKRLTRMEREVYDRMMRGYSNRQIASSLGICEKTVKNHLTSAFRKMSVCGRNEAQARETAARRAV